MSSHFFRLPLALFLISVGSIGLADDKPAPAKLLGDWMTEDKDAVIRIERYRGAYRGTIIWIDEPNYPEGDEEAGKPKHDRNNKDPELRNRPIIGLPILNGFEKFNKRKGEFTRGTVYDPNNGKTYKGYIRFDGPDRLKLKGYVGVRLAGRSTYWTRRTKDDPGPDEE